MALVATTVIGVLNFHGIPNDDMAIFARPILISFVLIVLGFLLRFSSVEIVETLKKYALLLFLSLFVTIPYFIWYFLGQDEYGPMVMIMGIINIDLMTVLQMVIVLAMAFVIQRFLVKKQA